MKKIKLFLLLIIFIIPSVIQAGDIDKFFNNSAIAMVVTDSGRLEGTKETKFVNEYIRKIVSEFGGENTDLIMGAINRILISYQKPPVGVKAASETDVVIGVDFGFMKIFADGAIGGYIEKTSDGISKLKGKKEAYTASFGSWIFISFAKETLSNYIKEINLKNTSRDFSENMGLFDKKGLFGFINLNGINDEMPEILKEGGRLSNISFYLEGGKNGETELNIKLNGSGKLFEMAENTSKKELAKYIDSDYVYISTGEMKEMFLYISSYLTGGLADEYIAAIKEVFGYDMSEIADLFGSEMVVKLSGYMPEGLIKLKNGKETAEYLRKIDAVNGNIFYFEGLPLYIYGNTLHMNKVMEPKNLVTLENDTFFYSDCSLGILGIDFLKDIRGKMKIRANNSGINANIVMKPEDIKKILGNIDINKREKAETAVK